MLLKSLDISGFKSFANKTHVEFSDGINAIVGDDGCGKSNVVEAVKWVLGERNPRNLRVSRMEEVIFRGAESKKAMDVAEVTVTIKNDTGDLPINVPEIEVRRQFYRSGKSKCFINSAPARLDKLDGLFQGAGMEYSMNMHPLNIYQVFSLNPGKQFSFFEKTAGINELTALLDLKKRQDEIVTKLIGNRTGTSLPPHDGHDEANKTADDMHRNILAAINRFAPSAETTQSAAPLSIKERAIAAIVLLFSVYIFRPPLFCFMDEIDEAMDEQNVEGLARVIEKFGGKSQYIIATRNEKAVSCANTILNVKMEESGISSVDCHPSRK